MDIFVFAQYVVAQATFYLAWIQRVSGQDALPKKNPIDFSLPSIAATRFGSQWPFGSAYSLAYLYGKASLQVPGNLGPLVNYISNSQLQSYNIFLTSGDIIKLAPSGSGFMFFLGPPSITLTYTQAYFDPMASQSPGPSGPSGPSASSGPSGSYISGYASRPVVAFRQITQSLDPVRYTVVSMQSLASLITLTTNSLSRIRATMWSDEFSRPTFGQYIIQPYLEFHSAFSLTISAFNSQFLISAASGSYTVDLAFGGTLSPNDFIQLLQSSINEAYGSNTIRVELSSIESNINYTQVATLNWYSSAESITVSVLPISSSVTLKHQCATAAMLGLYEINDITKQAIVKELVVGVQPLGTPSFSPVVTQWPVGFPFQRYADPGSPDTDGLLRLYTSTTLPNSNEPLPEPASLILTASEYTYRLLGPTSTLDVVAYENNGSLLTKLNIKVTLRNTAAGQYISNIILPDTVTGHLSLVVNESETYFGSLSNTTYYNQVSSSSTGYVKISDIATKNITFYLNNYSSSLLSGIQKSIYCNIELEPFGYKTLLFSDSNPGIFLSASYLSVQAWAGGGGSLLNTSTGNFYGGSSSRIQMTFEGPLQSIEAKVGLKGLRLDDNFCSGGYFTSLRLNNVNCFILGGGGGASLGSHGGIGGGPLGTPFTSDIGLQSNLIQFPGYSGSVDVFSLANNTQVLGPSGKPIISENQGPSGPMGPSGPSGSSGPSGPSGPSELYETWQGSGGSNVIGLAGYILDVPARSAGQGGSGSFDFSSVIYGGSGVQGSGVFGAGGGGPTVVQNLSSFSDFSILSITINGPWSSDVYSGPLGGGFGPYISSLPSPFYLLRYYSDSTSILNLLENYGWSRSRQIEWTSSVLQSLASKLFLDGVLAEGQQNTFSVTNTFNDINEQGAISYVALGPHDQWLPGTGGPNATAVDSGEQVLFDEGQTVCIKNDGQITNFEVIPDFLNTSFSGPGIPVGTVVTSIRFGASKPSGVYSSAIYLGLSSSVQDTVGPFTWLLRNVGLYATSPPVFSAGTLVRSKGLIATTSQWDQTFILSAIDSADTQALVDALYSTMIQTTFTDQSLLGPFRSYFTWPSDTPTGPTYFRDLWPVQSFPSGNNVLLRPPNNLITVRAFIRPVALPKLTGPLRTVQTIDYGQDQEVYVSKYVKEVIIYAFGAGGSCVDGIYAGSDGHFANISYTNLADSTILCRVGQGGGTGDPFGSHGGLNLESKVIGGGCTFVLTSLLKPLIYAGGGGSGALKKPLEKHFEYTGQYTTSLNPGGSGYMWGQSGSSGHAGSSGTSYAPGGLISKNIKAQKYYENGIGLGSNAVSGHGKLILEFIY